MTDPMTLPGTIPGLLRRGSPNNDPRFDACRGDRHTPSADRRDVAFDGGTVTTTCTVCGALLTSERIEWDANYGESATCGDCGEATPWCECDPDQGATP